MKLSKLMTSVALATTIATSTQAIAGGVANKVRTDIPPVTSENTASLFNAISFGFNGRHEEFVCSTKIFDTTIARDMNSLCASVSKVRPNLKPIRVYNPYTIASGPLDARIFCTPLGHAQGGANQFNWDNGRLEIGEYTPTCIRISHYPR